MYAMGEMMTYNVSFVDTEGQQTASLGEFESITDAFATVDKFNDVYWAFYSPSKHDSSSYWGSMWSDFCGNSIMHDGVIGSYIIEAKS
jgi:hypothetical protein